MPAVNAPGKILVTGASGFIAAQLSKDLLAAGFHVIGTVRSPEKGEYLKKLYDNDPKFSYVIVKDNEAVGAFDEAVKGVDGVAHTSSPFHANADDPQEVIGPAVKGTLSVLEAVVKGAPTVKRIVVTSSTAAIISADKDATFKYTEDDWNTFAEKMVEEQGKATDGFVKYLASKALAERAAWQYFEDQKKKGGLTWDLTVVNPPFVFGPTIQEVKNFSALNTSVAEFYGAISDPTIYNDIAKTHASPYNFVDVRDISTAHVLSFQKEAAGGERFIISNGPYSFQNFYDALHDAGITDVPRGQPETPSYPGQTQLKDKSEKILGLKYHTLQQTAVDTVKSLRERFPEQIKKVVPA